MAQYRDIDYNVRINGTLTIPSGTLTVGSFSVTSTGVLNGASLTLTGALSAQTLSISSTATIAGLLVLGAQATGTGHAVRADRAITAGAGLAGGGDLTVDRSLSVDFTGSSGIANTAARSDHAHSNYLTANMANVTFGNNLTANGTIWAGSSTPGAAGLVSVRDASGNLVIQLDGSNATPSSSVKAYISGNGNATFAGTIGVNKLTVTDAAVVANLNASMVNGITEPNLAKNLSIFDISGKGVISGCNVTATTPAPSMSVAIQPGTLYTSSGRRVVIPSGVTQSLQNSSATYDRIDVVYVQGPSTGNNEGSVAVVTGVAASSPVVPAIPSDAVSLAQILVKQNIGSITDGSSSSTNYVTDIRQLKPIYTNSANKLIINGVARITTSYGYVDIGSQSTNTLDITTDRSKFYFNKDLYADGAFHSNGANDLKLGTNGTARITVLNSNGFVGIGTVTPAYKLHIVGGDAKIDGGDLYISEAAGGTTSYRLKGSSGNVLWVINNQSGAASSEMLLSASYHWDYNVSFKYTTGVIGAGNGTLLIGQLAKSNANFTHGITAFYTKGLERMRIDSAGNVGIGVTSTTYKLEVAGTAKFSEQVSSTVATGTAPFSIASKTLVLNLNTELHNGQRLMVGATTPSTASANDVWFDTTNGSPRIKWWDGLSYQLFGANSYGKVKVGQDVIQANSHGDTLEIEAGNGLSIVADTAAEKVKLSTNNTIVSDTEPTTNLYDGLMWYSPSENLIRVYIESSFRPISPATTVQTFRNAVQLSSASGAMSHGISQFRKSTDVLLVHSNSVWMQEGFDYTLSEDAMQVVKSNGTWDAGTTLDFLCLAVYTTNQNHDLVMTMLDSTYAASADGVSNIPIGIPEYNPDTDLLQVYEDGWFLKKGEQWNLGANKTSIDLTYSLKTGDSIYFQAYKKVRDNGPVSDAYSRAESDAFLSSKANAADVYQKMETYTKTETDSKISAMASIDDAAVSTIKTWSSDKMSTSLASKSDTSHTHDYNSLTNKPVSWEVNVKEPRFGAKGDGIADDQPAIDAAIAYAYTNGISTVVLPFGTYALGKRLNGLVNKKNIRLRGDKATITLLGTTEDTLVDISGTTNIMIDGITFDGKASAITTYAALRKDRKVMIYCSNQCSKVQFVKNTFQNCVGGAMLLYGFADGELTENTYVNLGFDAIQSYNNAGRSKIVGNSMKDSFGRGVTMQGHAGEVTGIEILDNKMENLTRDDAQGIYAMGIELNVNVNRVFVTGNRIRNMGDMGISISGVYDGIVAQNLIETVGSLTTSGQGYGAGIELAICNSVVVTLNNIKYCTRGCIILDQGKNNVITNNILTQDVKTDYVNTNYCIFGGGKSTTAQCDGNLIMGNKMEGGTYGVYFPSYTVNTKMSENIFVRHYAAGFASTLASNKGIDIISNKFYGCFVVLSELVSADIKSNSFDGTGGAGYRGLRLYKNNKNLNIVANSFSNNKFAIECMEANCLSDSYVASNVMLSTYDSPFQDGTKTGLGGGSPIPDTDTTLMVNVKRIANLRNNYVVMDDVK